MRALIDTHAFLWGLQDDPRLSQRAKEVLEQRDLFMSAASVWEIIVKVQIGKLELPLPAGPYVTRQLANNGVKVLPIRLSHTLRLESLAMHHRDPFDRILIAQSLEESVPILTADPQFRKYAVETLW